MNDYGDANNNYGSYGYYLLNTYYVPGSALWQVTGIQKILLISQPPINVDIINLNLELRKLWLRKLLF